MASAKSTANFDPVARASELRGLLARNASQAERDRRLPDENVEAIESANLFKVMTPKRWGGYGAPLPEVVNTFAEVAKGCGSSGWVTMILAGCTWWASLLPDRGQEEIFGDGGKPKICGSLPPNEKGQQIQGGVRISGRFPFASGCWHASWANLAFQLLDGAQNVVDQAAAFVPMSELEIDDMWYVAGMRGTGSNTLIARDVFVPEHRIFSVPKLWDGERLARRHFGEPSDTYTFTPTNCIICISPVLGIAEAMLEEVIKGTAKRGVSFTIYSRQADSPVIQHQVAEASLKVASARLLAIDAAARVQQVAESGRQMDSQERARVRGAIGYAVGQLREAVDTLASIGGASGFADSSPLQRMWRDVGIATRHGLITTYPALEVYGRAILGVEGSITPLV
jgi:3-hydroxy-9,10-secoandrosta-1,3,5(10)-triene-9,17-dione monooxygenase